MKTEDVAAYLGEQIKREGGVRAWARKHKFSPSYVSSVAKGTKQPANRICEALGLNRTVTKTNEYRFNWPRKRR